MGFRDKHRNRNKASVLSKEQQARDEGRVSMEVSRQMLDEVLRTQRAALALGEYDAVMNFASAIEALTKELEPWQITAILMVAADAIIALEDQLAAKEPS